MSFPVTRSCRITGPCCYIILFKYKLIIYFITSNLFLTVRAGAGCRVVRPPFLGGFDRSQDAAQDVELVAVGLRAIEQRAQPAHQHARIGGVEESGAAQGLLKMGIEALHLFGARWRIPGMLMLAGHARHVRHDRLAQFIGHHLHRLRQIQRAVVRIGRDSGHGVAAQQFLVGEAGALAAKHQRHRPMLRQRGEPGGGVPRGHRLIAKVPRTRGRSHHPGAIANRLLHRLDYARTLQHAGGARGHGRGLRVRILVRPHQREVGQAHVQHRAGSGADVAGMGGGHQHDADAGKQFGGRQRGPGGGVFSHA